MGNLNYIVFGGVDSRDYGIYISGEGVFNAPERDVEVVNIPGKDGDLLIDRGRFLNIEVTYPGFNFEPNLSTFAERLRAFRAALASQVGYQRLEDSFHPDEFRLASFRSGLDINPVMYNTASTFDIAFDCKPQRFLKSGEEEIVLGQWGETQTVSGSIATFEAESNTGIKSLVVDIDPVQSGSGDPSPTNVRPISGWSGVNVEHRGKNLIPALISSASAYGVSYIAEDGFYRVRGTADIATWNYIASPYNPLKDFGLAIGETVTLTAETQVVIQFRNAGGTITNESSASGVKSTFTIPSEAVDFRVLYYAFDHVPTVGETVDRIIRWQLEAGNNSTPYEPYQKTEHKVEFPPVNIWDEEWEVGSYDLETGEPSVYANAIRTKGYISVKPSTNYYSFVGNNSFLTRLFYDINKNYISYQSTRNGAFTTPTNAYYMRFATQGGGAYGNVYLNDISINYPSIDHDYHPHNSNMTVYGGEIDVVTGVLTIDREAPTLNDMSISRLNSGYFIVYPLHPLKKYGTNAGQTSAISSCFFRRAGSAVIDNLQDNIFSVASANIDETIIAIRANNYSSVADLKSALGTNRICYELATPIEIQLTPEQIETILGVNNIWADTGEVSVEIGEDPNILVNPTPFEALPIFEVVGTGSLTVGNTTIDITGDSTQDIFIDSDIMEAYEGDNGAIISRNDRINLSGTDFPKLGEETRVESNGLTSVKITPKWWTI